MGVTCNTPKCVHYLHSAESFGAETITTTKIDNNGGEWTLQYRQPPIGEQPTEIVATTPTWSHEKNDFSNVFTIYLNRVPDSTSIMPSRQSPTGYWWIASRPAWGEKNIRFTNYDSLWNWIGSDEIYDFPYFAESFGAEEYFNAYMDIKDLKKGQEIKINGLMDDFGKGQEIRPDVKLRHQREWDGEEYYPEYHEGIVSIPIANDGSVSTESKTRLYYAVKYWMRPDLGDKTFGHFLQVKDRPMDKIGGDSVHGKPMKSRAADLRWDKDQERFFIDEIDDVILESGYISARKNDPKDLQASAYAERGIYSISPLKQMGAESLMAINQNTPISNFTTNELTHSSTVQGDFNQASINSSGHQNFEVRGAETFAARGTYNLYKGQEKVLKAYRDSGGKENHYDSLPPKIVNKLESIRNSETLWSDVNRWLWDNPSTSKNPYGGFHSSWDAESYSAEDNIIRFKVGERYTHRYHHGYGFRDNEVMRRTDKTVWTSQVNPETGELDSPLLVSRHKIHTSQPFELDGEIVSGYESYGLGNHAYRVAAGDTSLRTYDAESFGAESLEDLDKSQLIDLIKNLEDRDEYVKGYVENAAESFGAESQKLGIIYRIDRDDKTADILGVLPSYAEGKKAMTYMFKSALEEYSEDSGEDLMSFSDGKKEFEWDESRSKKKKHLDFYHPTGYEDIIIVLQEFRIETLMDFYDMINEDKFSAETFNAESFSAERNRVCNICNEIKPTRAYKFPTYKGMYEPVQVMIRDYCDSCAHADGLSAESFEAEKLHPALYRYKGKIKLRKGWTECQACDDLVKMNDINFAYLEGYGNATVCDACVEKNQGYKRMENYMRDKWTSWKDWGEKKEYSKKIVPVRKKSKWGESEISRLKHDGIIKGAEGMNTVRCNKCMWEGEEEDLVMFEDEDGFGKGCPKCETDAYLMDLEAESFGAIEMFNQDKDEFIGERDWEGFSPANFEDAQDDLFRYIHDSKRDVRTKMAMVAIYSQGRDNLGKMMDAESFAAEYGKRQRFGKRYVARDTKGKFISNVSVGRSLKADRRSKSKTPARSGFGHKGDSQKGASSEFKMPTDAKSLIGIGAVLGGLLAYLESKA